METCPSCAATFLPVLRDGTSYTHVCNDTVVSVRAKFDPQTNLQVVEEVRVSAERILKIGPK